MVRWWPSDRGLAEQLAQARLIGAYREPVTSAYQRQREQLLVGQETLEKLIWLEAHVLQARGTVRLRFDIEQRRSREFRGEAAQLRTGDRSLGEVDE